MQPSEVNVFEMPTESEPVRVIQGDCLEVMKGIDSGSIDAVVTDPPYGQTNERYDGAHAASLRPDVWAECFRVCGPNAALVSFAGSPTYHKIASAIEAGGWKVRQMWAWVYRDGMITSAYPKDGFDRLAPAMDPIIFATKGKVLLNVEREGDVEWRRAGNSGTGYSARSGSISQAKQARGRRPRTIVSDGVEPFEYFVMGRSGAGRSRSTDHPNEKPLALMRWLISRLPGGFILDPFSGSGTTGVAAAKTGRRCILIEQDSGYAEITRKRIAGAMGSGLLAPK